LKYGNRIYKKLSFLKKLSFSSAVILRKSERGFTLIELVAVTFLMGMTLYFAIPRFQSVIGTDETKKFSRWIMFKTLELREKAVREQKNYVLHISMDSDKLWVSSDSMSEEALADAENQGAGYPIPEDVRILDVEYPVKGKISMGRADICFYKGGYSDKVLIHTEDDESNRTSILIEPFLSKIKVYEDYAEFN
jgi:prepilin-type N-terminal cleavage/methylation domain-containing protein